MDKKSFTREELYNLVWTEPLSKIAKRYQITDSGIRKICKKREIPLPPLGYWQKKQYNKKLPIKPELKKHENEGVITLNKGDHSELSPFIIRKNEIERSKSLPTKVPKKLTNPHKLIIKAKEYLLNQDHRYGRSPGLLFPDGDILDIRVAPKNLSRALRIMDTFIKLCEAKNHKVSVGNWQTTFCIDGIDFEMGLREKQRIVKAVDKWSSRTYEPTGILCIEKKGIYKKEWKDGRFLLEELLTTILAKLELDAVKEHEWREEIRLYNEKRELEEQIKLEAQNKIDNELKSFKSLIDDANRWHQSNILRSYIEHIEEKHNPTEEIRNWIEWAKGKADWYDPTINKNDELLGTYSRKDNN